MSKHKFNIGDYIESDSGTQRYIIVDIDEANEIYICVDALCARGVLGILYNRNYKDFIGWAKKKILNFMMENNFLLLQINT